MSWGTSFVIEGNDLTEGNQDINEYAKTDEAVEQVIAGFTAAYNTIASGAIGDPLGKYKVILSGHANENHEPAPGWSNDCLTLSIYQVSDASN